MQSPLLRSGPPVIPPGPAGRFSPSCCNAASSLQTGSREAREQLQQLFQEALSSRPERLLAFTLTGEPWSRRLEAFALALARRPAESRFVTGTEYLIAKLHDRNPPATTDWHPEDGGIVAHLRARTMEILAAFYDERYRQEAQTPTDPRLERIAQAVGPQGPGAEIR